MTSAAKLVNWFLEHKFLTGGMGVMTYDTASSDDTVDILLLRPFYLTNQILHLTVTGNTELQRAFLEELVTMVSSMRIMAKGTSTNEYRSVPEWARQPGSFPCMAVETDIAYICRWKAYFPWFY
jgi:hypothetical protein